MKTNKELIDALQEFFLTQDPKVIAHTLAIFMIDLQRILNFENLEKDEQESLHFRILKNVQEIQKFAKESPPDNERLKYVIFQTKEQG